MQTSKSNYVERTEDTLDCVNQFYTDLHEHEDISIHHMNEILSKIETKRFPEDTLHDLEKELSVEELSIALKQMKNNQFPGIDGLINCLILHYLLGYSGKWPLQSVKGTY